jgi:hypothetical protein
MNLRTARLNLAIRLFCALLALNFLNLSIDSRDPNPDSIPEDLSFNDIESFAELIVEVALDKVNAFVEHEERDNHEGGRIHSFKYYCANKSLQVADAAADFSSNPEFWISDSESIQSIIKSVVSPPPKI